MAESLFASIVAHGYVIIFFLVFFVEIGIPNPVPNELVLLYVGSLTAIGHLNFIAAIVTVVAADFIGTSLLYYTFYLFGGWIVSKNFKWFPTEKLAALSHTIEKRGKWGIFVGRLIPFVRGYTSVAAGLLRIPPKVFLSVVIFSAVLWSGGYVLVGHFVGPHIESFYESLGIGQVGLISIIIGVILVWSGMYGLLESGKNGAK